METGSQYSPILVKENAGRDAVTYAGPPGPCSGAGVRLRLSGTADGEVTFDWPAVGRRVRYRWTGERLRLELEALVS
jgi:hypothetical protein